MNQKRQGRNCHSIYTNDLFVKYNMLTQCSLITPVVKDGFMNALYSNENIENNAF